MATHHKLSPEEAWEAKMRTLRTGKLMKSGTLKTQRGQGKRMRKRDKILNKVMGEWINNHVFIDNQKMIVMPEDAKGDPRTEIKLDKIKHILPSQEESCEFALTWQGSELASVTSPRKTKEKDSEEFMMGVGLEDEGSEDEYTVNKDRMVVFRAVDPLEAHEWVNALQRAIQVSKSTLMNSTSSVLREYSTIQPRLSEASALKVGSGRNLSSKKRHGKKVTQAEEMWNKANSKAKKSIPGELHAPARHLGAVMATISTTMVGGFAKSLLKAAVAPSWVRRQVSDGFQGIWVDAMIWMAPPIAFHATGDIPVPVSKEERRASLMRAKARKNRRASQRRKHASSTPTRVVLLNSIAECDVLFMQMLGKAVDNSHGTVKGFLPMRERGTLTGLGTVFELFGFLFLARKDSVKAEEADRKRILRYCRGLDLDDACEWILLFPERGYPNEKALEEQDDNPANEDRPSFDNLLLPCENELESVLEGLKDRNNVQVYDFTLAYQGWTGELPKTARHKLRNPKLPSYANLLRGTASDSIHIHSMMYEPNDITGHSGGVRGWLDERWEAKDKLLTRFASYQAFDPQEDRSGKVRTDTFEVTGSMRYMLLVWIFNMITFSFIFVYIL